MRSPSGSLPGLAAAEGRPPLQDDGREGRPAAPRALGEVAAGIPPTGA